MRGLAGKVVVVTGATKAMGEAIAVRFAEEGGLVVGCGRSADRGEAVAQRIRDAGGRAIFVRADITVEADVVAVVDAALGEFGQLDVVVNNAAAVDVIRGGGERPVTDEPIETFDRMLRVGVYGPFLLAKHAIPAMLKGGTPGGAFVHLSSTAAGRGLGAVPGYAASKGALEALSRQIGTDYGPRWIRSNTIRVGTIRVPDNAALHEHPVAGPIVMAKNMLPRVGLPEDVAAMAAFLASDDAGFVTGVVIPLDGGGSNKNAVIGMDKVYGDN
ncbi:SDR family NAD(P)-dependent oxidoreductase [Dactylosporangium sp. CA-092794]|uniref:SDR family NAD(P)-dependent oxidoreductase n=1 Tax=Dactylosporangium sp. CA-092794 TaxID=3239929 RepID=UPI003D8E23DF